MAHIGSYCKETRIGVMHCNVQWKNSGGCVLFTIHISDIVEEEARASGVHKHSNFSFSLLKLQ